MKDLLIQTAKRTGLVDPEQLAKYIQILIKDKEKRVKMGLAGKEMASNFSAENMVEKIDNLYKELLMQKNICF